MTLIEFLRARLDEDERAALNASPGPWTYGDIDSIAGGTIYDPTVAIVSVQCDTFGAEIDPRIRRRRTYREANANGEHIARFDPARVLAEVDAKRRIVDLCKDPMIEVTGAFDTERVFVLGQGEPWAPGVLRLLALPYSDHPDYDPAWSPGAPV